MMLPDGSKGRGWRYWLALCWRIYWRGYITAHSVGGSGSDRVTIRVRP